MKLTKREIFNIPNGITLTRLAVSPYFAKKLYENPRKWWLPCVALGLTDMEGQLARLGDGTKNSDGSVKRPGNERLAELGFHGSELGRKLDPSTDKLFGAEMVVAGLANRVLPKWLGALVLAQKVAVSAQTFSYEMQGIETHVTNPGRYGEAATNIGLAMQFAAESIDDPVNKSRVRAVGTAAALGGLAAASFAAFYQYRNEAHQIMTEAQAQT